TVARPEVADAVVALLLAKDGGTVGLSTGLYGAGGFGKTTLARQVCWNRAVRRWFRGGAFEVPIGDGMVGADLAQKVTNLIHGLGGTAPGTTDPREAGLRLGEVLAAQRRRVLLLVDDVWKIEQLRPFLHSGPNCTVLVTTRRPGVLPHAPSRVVKVDQMTPA